MKVLFLTRLYWPHIGGVEKHVREISIRVKEKGYEVIIITEKYQKDLKNTEIKNDIKIKRVAYPKVKYLGLLYIWVWLFKNRSLIKQADIVHCHDVFMWYLPFGFLYRFKPLFTTFHGWEGIWPIPIKNILLKRLAAKLSRGSICVGRYIEKHYRIKSNFVTYGAVDNILVYTKAPRKQKNNILYVGRLESDTGLNIFLQWLSNHRKYSVIFCGDGRLRKICESFGKVYGFIDPFSFLVKAEYCVPAGYLSALEAMAAKCKIKLFWTNPLKKDYWFMTPFYRFITKEKVSEAFEWVREQNWDTTTEVYLELWNIR